MKSKPYAGVLPLCRCLTCKCEFQQPWLNYIFLDCPPCRREQKLPVVHWTAVEHAPPEIVREQERRLGPIERPKSADTVSTKRRK